MYAVQNVSDATILITSNKRSGCEFDGLGIALLFGIGNAFDTVVSFGVYLHLLRKNRINVLDVRNTNNKSRRGKYE